MPVFRLVLSRILNKFICSGLSLPLTDVSSGLRLYDASIFKEINFSESDFSVLVEIVVKAYLNGFNVKEIPFHYQPRSKGRSHARIIKFGIGFLRVFWRMWKVRNTVYAADYDDRAFYSRIPAQRYWQRRRYKIICAFTGLTDSILDAGCGSSKILGAFPQAVGLDINLKKLRFNLSLGNPLCRADIKNLCFKNESFDCLICSEVIEHVPFDEKEFREFSRVIKKGGCLILGTPDYSKLNWIIIEKLYKMILPGGYADEHITRYTKKSLIDAAARHGFVLESHKYIMNAELICKFKKIS
jgi:ubiquinone/menaquinone biosynthesis C-methylase UbiE